MNKALGFRVNLKSHKKTINVGPQCSTKINALVGFSDKHSDNDIGFLKLFETIEHPPDIITDLSIISDTKEIPIWKRVADETPFIPSTVPIYRAKFFNDHLDSKNLLEIAIEQMEGGVGLITIHPTPTIELIHLSKKRLIPFTSRGGGMVIRDLLRRGDLSENIYIEILDDLIRNAKRTKTAISVGTTFRPGSIFDSLDKVHINEISSQIKLARLIKDSGVDTIIEGPGHCRPRDINRVSKSLIDSQFPIMALGPIPIDSAIGYDHIAGAIGSTLMGINGCAHILSAVTKEEHTGGVPNISSTIEAIESARIAAKIIDLELLEDDDTEHHIATLRSKKQSCIAYSDTKGCDRCSDVCPLIIASFKEN